MSTEQDPTIPFGNVVTSRLVGYTDRPNVPQGGTFKVHVAGTSRTTATLVRLRNINPDPQGAGLIMDEVLSLGDFLARPQRTQTGSYVQISGDPVATRQGLSVHLFAQPTLPHRGRQGLIANWTEDNSCGWALSLAPDGHLEWTIGDGDGNCVTARSEHALFTRIWYSIAASYDPFSCELRLIQRAVVNGYNSRFGPVVPFNGDGESLAKGRSAVVEPESPLLIGGLAEGANGPDGRTWVSCTFNGKIEAPRLYERALSTEEMRSAVEGHIPSSGLVAHWDFSSEISADGVGTDTITDRVGNRHGHCVNQPFRGCTGHNWAGHDDNYRFAPEQYGALWFHDDTFDDCRWDAPLTVSIPEDLPSGVYAVHLSADSEEDYVPFFVVPSGERARAKVAVVMSSYTYMAYGNETGHNPFDPSTTGYDASELVWAGFRPLYERDMTIHGHPAPWGLSSYDVHADGEGVAYVTWRRPLLTIRPGVAPAWNFPADMQLLHFLERREIGFDVITDHDIHAEGAALLQQYRAVLTVSHPEYTTERYNEAWQTYIASGGRGMYLGGNGMYWVTAQHPEKPWVMEMRRGVGGDGGWEDSPGESYLSSTGERSGPWRFRGRAGYKIWGTSYCAHALEQGTYFVRLPDAHDDRIGWILNGVEEDRIGDFGLEYGGAAGVEIDRYDVGLGTPPHTMLLASSFDHGPYAIAVPEDSGAHTETQSHRNYRVRADMTYFTSPKGGAVFATSSIAWLHSLPFDDYENNVATITDNVVRRFAEESSMPPVV